MNFIVIFTTICLLVAAVSTEEQNDNDLKRRLETLEARFEYEVAKLKEDSDRKISELEARVLQLEQTNERLNRENDVNKARVLKTDTTPCVDGISINKSNSAKKNQRGTIDRKANQNLYKDKYSHVRRRRALSDATNIAFTAYVDHNLDNQGPDQVLVYNKVLLNHGRAYNNYTGVFTAPIAGVYSFTFFIGQRDVNQFLVQLVVNDVHMIDAVCETVHATQDLQGGNSANLMLLKGDSVFVKHSYNVGTHLDASDTTRITSFSGFLIYPVEIESIIGK